VTSILVAKGSDLSQLAQMHAAAFATAWTENALRDLLDAPGTFAFACDEGFIVVRAAADEAEILTLAVRPQQRRRGLGTMMVREAAAHAHQQGSRHLFLEVAQSNGSALALYERLGFAEVGRRKAYYAVAPGKYDDALILRSNLPLPGLGNRPTSG
jgi:ribosomal-protein-alanine N-acetyltransferase